MDQRLVQQRQLLLEAEGYLDLASAFGERLPLRNELRDRLVARALVLLTRLELCDRLEEDVAYLRGRGLQIAERYQEAIEPLLRASERNPASLPVWLALGWCYKRVGRLDLAIESLERGLEVAADEAVLYYNLACYWSLARNPKLAVKFLRRALDIDPAYRDLIADEPDFDAVRQEPGFVALCSVVV